MLPRNHYILMAVKPMSGVGMIDQSPASTVPSPCIRNCCLDESDVCMGCGRHIDEILVWHRASNPERKDILALANRRLQQRAARQRGSQP